MMGRTTTPSQHAKGGEPEIVPAQDYARKGNTEIGSLRAIGRMVLSLGVQSEALLPADEDQMLVFPRLGHAGRKIRWSV